MAYGFHDSAPRLQIKNGGSYGIPYRALRVAGIDNLLAAGMMITSNHDAHMSTRNTVCCMGQGQAAGTAAALCASRSCGTRDLPYSELRKALEKGDVHLERSSPYRDSISLYGRTPSLCRMDKAETHSTRVAHQTTISLSPSIMRRISSLADSFKHKGITAEESQYFISLPFALQEEPVEPAPAGPQACACAKSLRESFPFRDGSIKA
jgi:hypothetical protein